MKASSGGNFTRLTWKKNELTSFNAGFSGSFFQEKVIVKQEITPIFILLLAAAIRGGTQNSKCWY
jgi:hypothetical protein